MDSQAGAFWERRELGAGRDGQGIQDLRGAHGLEEGGDQGVGSVGLPKKTLDYRLCIYIYIYTYIYLYIQKTIGYRLHIFKYKRIIDYRVHIYIYVYVYSHPEY